MAIADRPVSDRVAFSAVFLSLAGEIRSKSVDSASSVLAARGVAR